MCDIVGGGGCWRIFSRTFSTTKKKGPKERKLAEIQFILFEVESTKILLFFDKSFIKLEKIGCDILQ